MYTYIHTHTFTHTHTHTHAHVHTHTHAHGRTQAHTQAHTHTHMLTFVCCGSIVRFSSSLDPSTCNLHLTPSHISPPHPPHPFTYLTLLPSGQERFQSITNRFYSDTHAVIIVYDVTSEESFHDVDFWVREVQYYLPQELDNGMPVLFMGNKRDILDRNNEDQKSVKFRQVQEIANAYGFLKPIECSAKTGDNVKKAFNVLATELVQRRPRRGVVVNTARKKGCCNLL